MYRLLVLSLCALLCSCGGGSEPPASIAGNWSANLDNFGSTIRMTLTEQNSQVTGAGIYRGEAALPGAYAVAGVHNGFQAVLEFAYDNGRKATYAATLHDASHMSGTLKFQDGASITVAFVKQ